MKNATSGIRTLVLTVIALLAFAANSLLCRVALRGGAIDPAGFTAIRLASGTVVLALLTGIPKGWARRESGSGWISGLTLAAYAWGFSLAYVTLDVGAGALVLFSAVQLTMILGGIRRGERPGAVQWAGLAIALTGLVVLVRPGLGAPSLVGSTLMALAGVSWGIYSLNGQGASRPAAATAGNFLRASVLSIVPFLALLRGVQVSGEGARWAVLSGALASGLGYVIWYRALRGLTTLRASAVQLATPVLATAGGVAFLSEMLSIRLVAASVTILGGIWMAVAGRERRRGRLAT